MPRTPNTHGGGSNTNLHGLAFEQTTSLNNALLQEGYTIAENGEVYYKNVLIGYSREKYKFRTFLKENGVDLNVNSDILLPDDAFINITNHTVYIIEKKFQGGSGSVAEKIQTCEYKKQQYARLVSQMGYDVEYIYILSDYFNSPKFQDVLRFIKAKGCHYFFNKLPLSILEI